MKVFIVYLISAVLIAFLIHNAAKTKVPESTLEQKQIYELQNEVENLRYQVKQCRNLYRSL